MAVTLTISETAAGAAAADVLAGGSTGIDLGQVTNGQYSPLILQSANTGHQDLYIRHDAVIDPITDVKLYLAQFSGTYGGANSAAADFATVGAYGVADGASAASTANNGDGFSRGVHIDMDWQVATASQFGYGREAGGQMRIFGKSYAPNDGLSLALAFDLHVDAMSYWNGATEVDATTPVTGQIGISTDTILGNRGHFRERFYLNTAEINGGIIQFDTVVSFAYTA